MLDKSRRYRIFFRFFGKRQTWTRIVRVTWPIFLFNEYREKACAFQSQSFDRDILMNNNNTLY